MHGFAFTHISVVLTVKIRLLPSVSVRKLLLKAALSNEGVFLHGRVSVMKHPHWYDHTTFTTITRVICLQTPQMQTSKRWRSHWCHPVWMHAQCAFSWTCVPACSTAHTVQHAPAQYEFGKANGGRKEDSACFYVGQCFQISLRLHACLRVREALSVSVRREGEGLVITVCMFVCVCVDRQGQQVGWGEGGVCQMETAGPTERLAIVWPTSASLWLASVYQ